MSIYNIHPIDISKGTEGELWVNLGSIESVESYQHKPHKWIYPEPPRNIILRILKSIYTKVRGIESGNLVPDGEPFWAYKIRFHCGRIYHIKQCKHFWRAWREHHQI